MAGVLFVVCIPTEAKEIAFSNKPKKIDFEHVKNAQPIYKDNENYFGEKPFSQALSKSQEVISTNHPNTKDSVSVDIDAISLAKSTDILTADLNTDHAAHDNLSTIKRTRSCHNIVSSDSDLGIDKNNTKPLSVSMEPTVLRKSWDGYIKDIVTSSKKVKTPKIDVDKSHEILEISGDAPMELVMREILKKAKIENAAWQKSEISESYQIMFSVDSGYCHEKMLTMFSEWGIGEREGSSVSMIPCAVYNKPYKEPGIDGNSEEEAIAKSHGAWTRFMNSMRARLNVAHIVEEVKQDAAITFDFVTLLVVAGVLAAFGLVEDSTIFLASSMLISPLMGPIIAATFGTVIKDYKLTKIGVVNELIGIFLATAVGFFFGLIVCSLDARYGIGEGLTNEMLSRCELHSLLVGAFTAIPSGAAVAIAILGENIGSLVGVAISASLLPPAVNSGLLWALALLFMLHEKDENLYNSVIKTSYYSDHQATELAILGAISMTITIINIICIYVMAFLFLKIKEVAPNVSKNQRQFWKHDLKVARDYNKTCQQNEGNLLTQGFADEIAELQGTESERLEISAQILRNVARPTYQNTWSPMSLRNQLYRKDTKPTIKDLERYYLSMTNPICENDHIVRRMSIIGTGTSKALLGKNTSPPKYKSLIDEHIFRVQRRGSLQHYHTDRERSPKHNTSVQLDKIVEVSPNQIKTKNPSNGDETKMEKKKKSEFSGEPSTRPTYKKSRKFIVTPAADPLLPKKE